ncbi:matrix metalloproteinase-C-like [Watersipora subatra]|uniref:matrix metalloproteinase-C-like n=1 Tax=Watersipora subatra TaxID=2589382 RepID=UPI00355B3A6A
MVNDLKEPLMAKPIKSKAPEPCLISVIASAPILTVNTDEGETNTTETDNSTISSTENLSLDDQIDFVCQTFNLTLAAEYLERYGYSDSDVWRSLPDDELEEELREAFILFQAKQEIAQTGIFDNATKHEMCIPRCDFPDIVTPKSSRVKRYKIGKERWDSGDFPLTVGFSDYSTRMGRQDQERAFMRAADSWARVSGLSFKKGPARGSKITIGFAHYDGPWGVLGKAWFPKTGRIVFENKENWESKIPNRGGAQGSLAFYSVAMHELGHALGISHSNVKNAIMHPQYQRDVVNLQNDDIRAITALYGSAGRGNRNNGGTNNNRNNRSGRNRNRNNKGRNNRRN